MRAHKTRVTIPADHQLMVRLPDDFPAGSAEVIILADAPIGRHVVKLSGALAPDAVPPTHVDPVADALQEFRREREQRFEKLEMEARSKGGA